LPFASVSALPNFVEPTVSSAAVFAVELAAGAVVAPALPDEVDDVVELLPPQAATSRGIAASAASRVRSISVSRPVVAATLPAGRRRNETGGDGVRNGR